MNIILINILKLFNVNKDGMAYRIDNIIFI